MIFIVIGAIGYFVVAQRMKVAEIGVMMEYLPGIKGLSKGLNKSLRKAKKDK